MIGWIGNFIGWKDKDFKRAEYVDIDGPMKYRLTDDLVLKSRIKGFAVQSGRITLATDGTLTMLKGFEYDGASGPTFDTENSMTASAGHDALYRLITENLLSKKKRKPADKDLKRWLRLDGMSFLRRRAWYRAVRAFGGDYID